MEKEKISVIVPIYNVEMYLDRCIASVCEQTYQNLEIILVDDGSPDGCGQICDSWAEKDDRIKVIHQLNGGVSKARNVALDVAGGEYVAFLDSDDYVEPNMYEALLRLLKESGCDISLCAYKLVDESGKDIQDKYHPVPAGCMTMKDFLALQYLNPRYHCTIDVTWNRLFSREIVENVRFREGTRHEDTFFLNDYLDKVERIAITDKEYYCYRQRKNSFMGEKVSIQKRAHFYALRERTEVCTKLDFGKQCIRSNAVRCVNEGIGLWAALRCHKLLPQAEEKVFYKDVVSSCKKYKRYGNLKQRILWWAFRVFPGAVLFGYRIKKSIH